MNVYATKDFARFARKAGLNGTTLLQACEQAGAEVPRFCYHERLSIAGNCRMCLVEVVGGPPKPAASCAMQVKDLRPGPDGAPSEVRTNSPMVRKAREGVMEFLLINHPLDCPICDQGGECQLQDLAVGYGGSSSRYEEEKRVVAVKDVGPLISMQEMSRCIHCTRCVRFGQEVAGVMELGMSHRGEHAEIETFVGQSVDSELSGNMIDICPVGALTSKPFRYSARTWELSRRKSISPHDSTGANLIVQVKNNKVMRVVPLENEEVNECWIADRDRFSYEALNGDDRLASPMLKQGGQWIEVDWQTALEYVVNGLQCLKKEKGASNIGALVSPHSTLEELYLAGAPIERMLAATRAAAQAARARKGAQVLGINVEGPFLNPSFKGAQPEAGIVGPDPAVLHRILEAGGGHVRVMTIAPEMPGAIETVKALASQGVLASVGHSGACYDDVGDAVKAGLRLVTHTYNGMRGLHHREPGVVGAALVHGELACEIIADGIHVHPAAVKLVAQAKGSSGTVLMTDAMRATGLPDGHYELGGQHVIVTGGAARLETGVLAGSTLTMDAAVRNMVKFAGIPLHEAISMASSTPARLIGLADRKGRMEPEMDADIVLLDAETLQVKTTLVMGEAVYERK